MRGWLVINTANKTRLTISSLDRTDTSDKDEARDTFYGRSWAVSTYGSFFKMNGVSALEASLNWTFTLTSAGLGNPEEHVVYYDFDTDAIESFLKTPGIQEFKDNRRMAKEGRTFAKHQKRGELGVPRSLRSLNCPRKREESDMPSGRMSRGTRWAVENLGRQDAIPEVMICCARP